jgi:tetratricopeptide (TPR) repeat protein
MPSMQLIPYAPPSLISDRFLFIAVWPAILLIVAGSWRLKPLLRTGLLLVVAISWTAQTIKHPLDWRDPQVLIDNELRAYPGYAMPAAYKIFDVLLPRGLYGDAIEAAGTIANPQIKDAMVKLIKAHYAVHVGSTSTGNPQNAMALLWELFHALKQRPAQSTWDPSMYNLWETIRDLFEKQWKYLSQRYPDDAVVHYNAGLWMVEVRNYQEAIGHLRAASESKRLPQSLRGPALERLGLALLGTGQFAEAESSLLAALKQPQADARVHCLLAMLYKRTGRLEEAARAGNQCLNAPNK